MVTNSFAAPLLFLTTFTGLAPTGRNARVQSRSNDARRTNPVAAHHGCFGTFALDGNYSSKRGYEDEEARRNASTRSTPKSSTLKRRKAQHISAPANVPPLRILATHISSACNPLPPNVEFEDVLKVAAFHIRRKAAQLLNSDPERALDALRCRQWCSVSATFVSLGRSPYLDSAIACVVSKVQQVVSGAANERRILVCYADALYCLRAAVSDPSLHDRLDMLAATQVLAIYEMLDSPETSAWSRHIAGVAAMANLQEKQRHSSILTTEQAAPMFVEALLNDDDSFFESKQWMALLQILAAKQSMNPEATGETMWCFRALRSLFADWKASTRNELGWSTRFALLSQTHQLRYRLKSVVVRSEHRFMTRQQTSRGCDVLGLCLVSIMMLDRLILTLRQTNTWEGHNLEVDTHELCTQVIRHELNTAEAFPAKDLLLAFQRQHDYPLLAYDD